MRLGRGARRAIGAAVLSALLAGCGSGGTPELMRRLAEVGGAQLGAGLGLIEAEAAPPPREMTRAEIEAFPAALIAVQAGGAPRAYFYAVAENGGYVTYKGAGAQTLTFRGAALTASHAFAEDLAGYRSDAEIDPLLSPRPPEAWPERLVRVLRFRDRSGHPFSRSFQCAPETVGQTVIRIAELDFPLTEIREPCRSPSHAFVNRYWVAPDTGRVWKSEQWAGPLRGTLTVEVLRPFAGG